MAGTVTPYYTDNSVALYRGDARDVLPTLVESVDLLLTDPPYGMAFSVASDGVRQGVRVVRQVVLADYERRNRWDRSPERIDGAS